MQNNAEIVEHFLITSNQQQDPRSKGGCGKRKQYKRQPPHAQLIYDSGVLHPIMLKHQRSICFFTIP
jgi:hypothetical protein